VQVKVNGENYFRITTKYGVSDSLHHTGHTGVDLAMPIGTEIHSPIDGTVITVRDLGNWNAGKYIKVRTEDGNTDLIFGHLSEFKVKVGDRVDKGDLIALSGNTGHSTGPHLHLGARDAHTGGWLNPEKWVDIFQEVSADILGFVLMSAKFVGSVIISLI